MTAAKSEIYPTTASAEQPVPAESVTWEVFEKEYLTREDGYKYEWVRGKVVQTPRDMNQYQYYILDICSAAPALPGFQISAEAIFQKPAIPA